MIYRRLADFVVIFHLLIAIFFLLGGVFTLLNPWIALAHVPLAVWVSSGLIAGWTCPLTPLENRLRVAAGNEGYSGGFIDHYMMPMVAPSHVPGGNRKTEVAIGVVTGVMNAVLYVIVTGHLLDD
jgi:hypothetical protein